MPAPDQALECPTTPTCECPGLPRCSVCGYTRHDASFWGDHGRCRGAIPDDPAPPFSQEAVERAAETIRLQDIASEDGLREECNRLAAGRNSWRAEVERLRAENAYLQQQRSATETACDQRELERRAAVAQRDALADAATALLEEVPYACPARDQMREALRKAGR